MPIHASYWEAWKLPAFGEGYPLRWKVELRDGDFLTVESVRDDQEMVGDGKMGTGYEGFVRAVRTMTGVILTGFGVVEMAPM
ncbi:hypothetical protein AWENTII_011363 [Aspergillus wentii]